MVYVAEAVQFVLHTVIRCLNWVVKQGHIELKSPVKMSGPIIPQIVSGSVPRISVEGTLKVENLQFELLDSVRVT